MDTPHICPIKMKTVRFKDGQCTEECSEEDLKTALIDALSETFASENLDVSAIYLCEESIHLFLDKSEIKKLLLN